MKEYANLVEGHDPTKQIEELFLTPPGRVSAYRGGLIPERATPPECYKKNWTHRAMVTLVRRARLDYGASGACAQVRKELEIRRPPRSRGLLVAQMGHMESYPRSPSQLSDQEEPIVLGNNTPSATETVSDAPVARYAKVPAGHADVSGTVVPAPAPQDAMHSARRALRVGC